jgi:hypothetical protein
MVNFHPCITLRRNPVFEKYMNDYQYHLLANKLSFQRCIICHIIDKSHFFNQIILSFLDENEEAQLSLFRCIFFCNWKMILLSLPLFFSLIFSLVKFFYVVAFLSFFFLCILYNIFEFLVICQYKILWKQAQRSFYLLNELDFAIDQNFLLNEKQNCDKYQIPYQSPYDEFFHHYFSKLSKKLLQHTKQQQIYQSSFQRTLQEDKKKNYKYATNFHKLITYYLRYHAASFNILATLKENFPNDLCFFTGATYICIFYYYKTLFYQCLYNLIPLNFFLYRMNTHLFGVFFYKSVSLCPLNEKFTSNMTSTLKRFLYQKDNFLKCSFFLKKRSELKYQKKSKLTLDMKLLGESLNHRLWYSLYTVRQCLAMDGVFPLKQLNTEDFRNSAALKLSHISLIIKEEVLPALLKLSIMFQQKNTYTFHNSLDNKKSQAPFTSNAILSSSLTNRSVQTDFQNDSFSLHGIQSEKYTIFETPHPPKTNDLLCLDLRKKFEASIEELKNNCLFQKQGKAFNDITTEKCISNESSLMKNVPFETFSNLNTSSSHNALISRNSQSEIVAHSETYQNVIKHLTESISTFQRNNKTTQNNITYTSN